jgi:hypothetical protein
MSQNLLISISNSFSFNDHFLFFVSSCVFFQTNLESYAADPENNWQKKDVAIWLVITIKHLSKGSPREFDLIFFF